MGLSENQTLLSCKPGPKPQAAQMTTLARKKKSLELIFSPGLQEARICQSFHSNNSFGVDCTRLKDTKRDWAHILQMLSKMWAGGGRWDYMWMKQQITAFYSDNFSNYQCQLCQPCPPPRPPALWGGFCMLIAMKDFILLKFIILF